MPLKQVRQLEGIGSRTSRSFLTAAAGKNLPWRVRDKQNCAAGEWLSVFQNRLNVTRQLADEWRDNVRLRYNHSPLEMPAACDGSGAKMTVEHALSCKMGGLVHIRHNDVADEWRHLCGTALSPC